MSSTPSVNIARLTYLLICEAAGLAIASALEIRIGYGLVGGLLVAGFFIWIETLMKGFTLRGFSTATFGLGVGLLCAFLLTRVEISGLLDLAIPQDPDTDSRETLVKSIRFAVDIALYSSFGFLGAVLALRSNRDDFAFVIPYVRFRQDASTGQPVVIDAETVIDGRVAGIVRAGFLDGRLVVPVYVLDQLQQMAASSQNGTRLRGQRGLDSLEAMRKSPDVQITIHDSSEPAKDAKLANRLIETARLLGARLMTGEENLGKVARLQGLQVLNIDELDSALKPPAALGDKVRIALVRGGKEDHQAVGYLPDGTMIVVNNGVSKIGSTVEVTVVSTLHTSAGLMVFSEIQ